MTANKRATTYHGGSSPEQRIDAALDSVLRASGSALKHYTLPGTLEAMRDAMRKVMSDSYIRGGNDWVKALTEKRNDQP